MWADVQRDLAEILSSRLFPILATDPGYRVLRNAGLASIPESTDGKIGPRLCAGAKWLAEFGSHEDSPQAPRQTSIMKPIQ